MRSGRLNTRLLSITNMLSKMRRRSKSVRNVELNSKFLQFLITSQANVLPGEQGRRNRGMNLLKLNKNLIEIRPRRVNSIQIYGKIIWLLVDILWIGEIKLQQ